MKALLIDTATPRVTCLYPDSALGRDAMPLFMPDGAYRGRVHLALRVGRLGKAVSPKFAPRYIDAYAPVLVISELTDSMAPSSQPTACFADSAITTGRWAPLDKSAPIDVADGIPLTEPDAPGRLAGTIDTADIDLLAAVCVPLVTASATIKTGDLLITDRAVDVVLTPDTYIKAADLLRVKIK